MPCYDPRDDTDNKIAHQAEAVLCAVVRKYGLSHVSTALDKQCGVSQSWLVDWWKEHELQDTLRKQREAAANKNRLLTISAISKLTEAEIKALGIKVKK